MSDSGEDGYDNIQTYQYEGLSNSSTSIRLLSLFPAKDYEDIRIELYEERLFDRWPEVPSYEALSWCWGTSTAKIQIKVTHRRQDFDILISQDLHAALKGIRHRNRTRVLWIDAICINQKDVLERNSQVALMVQIYSVARKVCVWLGQGNSSSKMAIDFIKKEVIQLQSFDELCDNEGAAAKWSSLLELMQRPWFSRRWVIQEIVLAKSAELCCGKDVISWADFALAVELFMEVESATHRLSEVMRKDPKFYHVPGWLEYVSSLGAGLLVDATRKLVRKNKMGGGRGERLMTLGDLVSTLGIFQNTVPHDTIYSLLSIAKDVTPVFEDLDKTSKKGLEITSIGIINPKSRYVVDYNMTYTDVCKQFIGFSIKQEPDQTKALDIICRPWAQGKKNRPFEGDPNGYARQDDKLPSWIPQLSEAPFAMYSRPGSSVMIMGRKNANVLVGNSSTDRNYSAVLSIPPRHPIYYFGSGIS